MNLVKTVIIFVVVIVVSVVGTEVGLLLSGLNDFKVGETSVSENSISIPVTIPNKGFIAIGGNVKIIVLDASGNILSQKDNSFDVPSGETKDVQFSVVTPTEGEPAKVSVQLIVRIAGFEIPIPPVEQSMMS